MKLPVALWLAAGLFSGAIAVGPATAQSSLPGEVVANVCMPYANRARSFERSISTAREMKFRRPSEHRNIPLEDYASEIDMVLQDGGWRVRLEEGSIEYGDGEAYAVTCSLSSPRASLMELTTLARSLLRDERYWSSQPGTRRWERLGRNSEERRLEVEVVATEGQRPTLVVRGLYF